MNIPPVPTASKEELWIIAWKLGVEVEQLRVENGSLRDQLTQAQETIQGLQAQLALPKKTATNSSLPPSVSHKKKCEKGIGQRRGRKPGHLGVSRSRQEPEIVIECRPEVCRACGPSLSGEAAERFGSPQVLELP